MLVFLLLLAYSISISQSYFQSTIIRRQLLLAKNVKSFESTSAHKRNSLIHSMSISPSDPDIHPLRVLFIFSFIHIFLLLNHLTHTIHSKRLHTKEKPELIQKRQQESFWAPGYKLLITNLLKIPLEQLHLKKLIMHVFPLKIH